MVALSVGKKRELGALSSMLAKTVGVVSLVAILASCGTSPGYSYTVGGTVSGLAGSGLVLQNNGGDDHPISADGYFTFATPLTDEAAYNITVKTQPANPAQTCIVVSNGTGTIISAPVVDVVVSCMTSPTAIAFSVESGGKFAYVANTYNFIWAYPLNSDGTFGAGNEANTGKLPASIAVAAPPPLSGKFAYVANTTDGTISTYTIDPNSGELKPTCGSGPLPSCPLTGKYPAAVTVDHLGQFVYVANMGDNTISTYTIDSSSGELKPTCGSSTLLSCPLTGTSPVSIAVDPLGQFAYVANEGSNSIWIYTISPTDGTLAAPTVIPQPVTVGTNPTSVVTVSVPSLGEFAYVANMGNNTISAFSIETDGSLKELTLLGSPFSTGTGTYPTSITIDPSGQFAYVINAGDGSIWAYPIIQSTGALGTPSGPL